MGSLETMQTLKTYQENVDKDNWAAYLIMMAVLLPSLVITIIELKKSQLKKFKNGKIPSLPTLPLIGPLHHLFYNRNDIAKMLEAWAQKYETLARTHFLGIPVVLINSPTMLQKLHSSNNPGHLEKAEEIYSKLFVGLSGKGMLLSKVEQWTPHRKLLTKAFNYESLKSYVTIFNKHAKTLVSKLDTTPAISDSTSNSGDVLATLLHVSCLEVISEIVLGMNMDSALTQIEYQKFHTSLSQARDIISRRFHQPWLLLDFIWKLHPYKKELETSVEFMEWAYLKVVEKRKESKSNEIINNENGNGVDHVSKCVLDVMVNANWSEEEILSESATLLLGGHETISLAMAFLLFLLATEPKHQLACQEEVDKLFQDLEASGEEITIESLSQLKYLERCIKETLRMFPTAPVNWRHLKAPLQLDDDIVLESGTLVMYTMWSLHRNPKYYPNPEKFDPDRFLPDNCKSRPAHAYIPFSSGSRNCIGWKMAMLEMTTMAAVILRNFNIFSNDKLDDVKVKFSFTIWPIKQPNVTLIRRSKCDL